MTVKATTQLKSKNDGKGIQELEARTQSAGTKIGFIKGLGIHPGGSKNSPYKDIAGTATISEIAAYNEFGTETIPERPFLRTTIKENTPEYSRIVKEFLKKIVNGEMKADKAVKILAEKAVADVKNKIDSISEPANTELTKEWKGSSNPLIDTGLMRGSVSWEMVKK